MSSPFLFMVPPGTYIHFLHLDLTSYHDCHHNHCTDKMNQSLSSDEFLEFLELLYTNKWQVWRGYSVSNTYNCHDTLLQLCVSREDPNSVVHAQLLSC